MALHHPNPFAVALVFTLLFASSACGLRNITINDDNQRIKYSPSQILPEPTCRDRADNDDCAGNWWTEHRATDIHDTFGPNTSCEFEFTGSAFYFFAVTLTAGASGFFSIDGEQPKVIAFTSPNTDPKPGVFLWSKTDLDGSQRHKFRLDFDNASSGTTKDLRQWLGVDYFLYTVDDNSQDVGGQPSGTPPLATPASPPPNTATGTPSTPSPHPVPPPQGGSPEATGTVQPSPSGNGSEQPSSSESSSPRSLSKASQAGIAAGVTSAVAFLVFVPLTVWLIRRRFRAAPVPVHPIALQPAGYAFATTGAGSASSTDGYMPVGPLTARAPAQYYPPDQRRYSAAFVSSVSSPGLPVDERPPPVPAAPSPPRTASRQLQFQLHNPDASSHGTASHVGGV